MFALLALLVALLAGPSVQLSVTQTDTRTNVRLLYTVTGPYNGRVCVDIDGTDDAHVAAFCAPEPIDVMEGSTLQVVHEVHGPAGDFVLTPVLPDTPGDADMVKGTPQQVHVNGHAGPGISAGL